MIALVEAQTCPSAELDTLLERQARRVDAQFKLLDLDNFEALVSVGWLDLYQDLAGVAYDQRDQLKVLLEEVATTGDRTIQELIAQVQSHYRNGSSSSVGSSDPSSSEDWL